MTEHLVGPTIDFCEKHECVHLGKCRLCSKPRLCPTCHRTLSKVEEVSTTPEIKAEMKGLICWECGECFDYPVHNQL